MDHCQNWQSLAFCLRKLWVFVSLADSPTIHRDWEVSSATSKHKLQNFWGKKLPWLQTNTSQGQETTLLRVKRNENNPAPRDMICQPMPHIDSFRYEIPWRRSNKKHPQIKSSLVEKQLAWIILRSLHPALHACFYSWNTPCPPSSLLPKPYCAVMGKIAYSSVLLDRLDVEILERFAHLVPKAWVGVGVGKESHAGPRKCSPRRSKCRKSHFHLHKMGRGSAIG